MAKYFLDASFKKNSMTQDFLDGISKIKGVAKDFLDGTLQKNGMTQDFSDATFKKNGTAQDFLDGTFQIKGMAQDVFCDSSRKTYSLNNQIIGHHFIDTGRILIDCYDCKISSNSKFRIYNLKFLKGLTQYKI